MSKFTSVEMNNLVREARSNVQAAIKASGKPSYIWAITEGAATLNTWESFKVDIKELYDLELPDLIEGVTALVVE